MDKQYLFVAVILSAILLVGCSGGNNQDPITDPFIGGNTGIITLLDDGAPPPAVFDSGGDPFSFNVVIQNVGEADIGPGTQNPYVYSRLEGINPLEFGVSDNDLVRVIDQEVRGAHKNLDGTKMGGDPANFAFENLNYKGHLQGTQQYTLRGVVCYDYSNIATTQICISNSMLQNVQDTTICSIKGEKQVYNSGGPLHVTHVVQNQLTDNKTQVSFVVEHVGPGEFFGRQRADGSEEWCDPNFRNMNKYKVYVEIKSQAPGAVITCLRLNNDDHGFIYMYSGNPQQISCTVRRPVGTLQRIYTDTLSIKTQYRYSQFIEQGIMVQPLPMQ